MKKWLLLIFLICGVVFSQEVEIISSFNDSLFSDIAHSYIYHDTLMYCFGPSIYSSSYDIRVTYNIARSSELVQLWVNDPSERTGIVDFIAVNDSLFYMLAANRHTCCLETYLWYSNETHPTRIDSDTLEYDGLFGGTTLFLKDTLLYITTITEGRPHFIVNIADECNPEVLTAFPPYSRDMFCANHFVIEDTFLITLGNHPNYVIYNISEPLTPVVVNQFNFSEINPEWESSYIRKFHLIDNYLIVCGTRNFLEGFIGVIDITNIVEPDPLNYIPTSEIVDRTVVNGEIIVFQNSGSHYPYPEFQIYDFSTPLSPSILYNYPESTATDRNQTFWFHSNIFDGKFYSSNSVEYEDTGWVENNHTLFDISSILTRYYTVNLSRGWNLISYPLFEKMAISDYLGDEYLAFSFTPSSYLYNETDSLSPGEAVWVLSENDTSIIYSECPNTYMVEKTLYPGWNLVGPTLLDLPTDGILCNPEIIPPIYRFDSFTMEYTEADTLRITQGYWVFANDTTEVILWREIHDSYR